MNGSVVSQGARQRSLPTPEQRREIAHRAHQCAKWLKISGFEVLAITGGLRQPNIYIKPSPLCKLLEWAIEAYERTPMFEIRYQYVVRFGCMVRWEIGGAE